MSLLPLLLSELDDISLPNIYDQHFGLPSHYHNDYTSLAPRAPYHNGDYFGLATPRVLSAPLRSGYLRPSRHTQAQDSGVSNYLVDKEGLKVNLDVQQFKPEELDVKVVDDYLVVHAKHEERSDQHGFISREFTRRYRIPDTVDAQAIASKLSSDGVLSIQAPKKQIEGLTGERNIPVIQTNQPAIKQTTGATANKVEDEPMQ
uniref:Alpha-crystallin B chain n=1 Tax=Cacopsylla melanoneura TaxID=428564 RepID=A0A8D8U6V2_9HEMI